MTWLTEAYAIIIKLVSVQMYFCPNSLILIYPCCTTKHTETFKGELNRTNITGFMIGMEHNRHTTANIGFIILLVKIDASSSQKQRPWALPLYEWVSLYTERNEYAPKCCTWQRSLAGCDVAGATWSCCHHGARFKLRIQYSHAPVYSVIQSHTEPHRQGVYVC